MKSRQSKNTLGLIAAIAAMGPRGLGSYTRFASERARRSPEEQRRRIEAAEQKRARRRERNLRNAAKAARS